MSVTITPKNNEPFSSTLVSGGIQKILAEKGRLPPVTMIITPIEKNRPVITLFNFIGYTFDSSMMIPVDTFSFNFANPDSDKSFYEEVKEGDIVSLYANDFPIACGIIDTVEIDTETESGERVTVTGRDLLSQFEDQDVVSIYDAPIYGNVVSIQDVFLKFAANTRIQDKGLLLKNVPSSPTGLLATTPGESKLTALQRFLEGLNCLFWLNGNGTLNIGKPNFSQGSKGVLKLNKKSRDSNVTSMKVVYSAANIPTSMLPIWTGQEEVQNRIANQRIENKAFGPTRLRASGHRVPKAMVVSHPGANNPQALSDLNILNQSKNLLQAMADRELARQNYKERIVQVVVPSHYNEIGEPYVVDTIYKIEYDRGFVDSEMYLYQVQYSLSEGGGQKTTLYFCNKYTIVAGNKMAGT